MILRAIAPAKVNLCLFLGPTRADGRHELVTVFESISLADELELTLRAGGEQDQVVCPAVHGPNLVADALAALRRAGWSAPPVRIEIAKRIPIAAGLGGGSADAAAALRLADELERLPEGLAEQLARALGADVPSQLEPGLWLGTGAGETLEPVRAVEQHVLAIVPLPHALATAEVYREADRLGLGRGHDELAAIAEAARGGEWPLAVNDLEPAARSLCPEVGDALEAVRGAGADDALVCGSGPTVAGIFWGEQAAERAAGAVGALRGRYPDAVEASPVQGVRHNELLK